MGSFDDSIRRAQQAGVPVEDVIQSYATHLTKERRRIRDNPGLLDASKPPDHYNLAVTEERTASGVKWRTLGGHPAGVADITVTATSMEAARNKRLLKLFLCDRYIREFASAMQRAGMFQTDLDGRRAAMALAIASVIGDNEACPRIAVAEIAGLA